MRLARLLVCALAICAVSACGSGAVNRAEAPPCATTFAHAVTSPDPTPGVWDCLTASYRGRLQGQGDGVFAVPTPLWTHYRYLGQDRNIALFELKVNGHVDATVYDPPVTHVIMAVYLDPSEHVDRAKAATPS